MKYRSLVITTAVASGLVVVPFTINPVLAADLAPSELLAGSMADRSNPSLKGIPSEVKGADDFYNLRWDGLAADATISSVSILNDYGHASGSGFNGGVYLSFPGDRAPVFSLDYGARSENGTVRGEFPLVIVYADGSIDKVTQVIETRPSKQKDAYQPYIEDESFAIGKLERRLLHSLPDGARVTVVSAPEGWQVSLAEPKVLEVVPGSENRTYGSISLAVTYSDGTSETVTMNAYSEPAREPLPEELPVPGDRPNNATETVEQVTTSKVSTTVVAAPDPVTKAAPTTVTTTLRTEIPVTTVANGTTIVKTEVREVPTTIVSTVQVTPIVTSEPGTTGTETEPSTTLKSETNGSSKGLRIAAVVIALLAALGGAAAALVNNPAIRNILPI